MFNSSNCFNWNNDGEITIITIVVFVDSDSDIKSIYAQPFRENVIWAFYYQVRKVITWKTKEYVVRLSVFLTSRSNFSKNHIHFS